jgi:hypothetical protein
METDDSPQKQPIYYEVVFSKRGSALNEYWRVYIELKDTDADLLSPLMNAKLKTLRIVRHAEFCRLRKRSIFSLKDLRHRACTLGAQRSMQIRQSNPNGGV